MSKLLAQSGIYLALIAVSLILGAGLLANTMMTITQIWPTEKLFDNPWALNNGSPRILQANQLQDEISELSNIINISDPSQVIGARIEYKVTLIDCGANLPDGYIYFNDINVAAFHLNSRGTPVSGTANVALNLLKSQNQITIRHTNAWGGWSKVSYDVVLVLGYEAPPIIPPTQGGGGTTNGGGADFWLWVNGFTYGIPNWVLLLTIFVLLLLLR